MTKESFEIGYNEREVVWESINKQKAPEAVVQKLLEDALSGVRGYLHLQKNHLFPQGRHFSLPEVYDQDSFEQLAFTQYLLKSHLVNRVAWNFDNPCGDKIKAILSGLAFVAFPTKIRASWDADSLIELYPPYIPLRWEKSFQDRLSELLPGSKVPTVTGCAIYETGSGLRINLNPTRRQSFLVMSGSGNDATCGKVIQSIGGQPEALYIEASKSERY